MPRLFSRRRGALPRKQRERMPGSTMTPKYQVLPDLPAEEFQALKEDIRRRGVQVPIEITTEDEILDGHQRLRACEQLGIKDYPVKVVAGLRTDQEKRHHAIRANLLRRQLTREQRRTLIDCTAYLPTVTITEVVKP